MNHQGSKILQTERLTLRPFQVSDAQAMFENWANDPQVTKYVTWPPHGSIDVTRELLKDWCAKYVSPDYYNWVIELNGEAIGNISVVAQSERNERADIGYCLSRKWWGRGIMTEAFREVIRYLFEEVGVHRIEAEHAKNNPASGKVMQKCGLSYEGTARKRMRLLSTGEWEDIVSYAILREDYFKEAKK